MILKFVTKKGTKIYGGKASARPKLENSQDPERTRPFGIFAAQIYQ